jgi:hypothetical protein
MEKNICGFNGFNGEISYAMTRSDVEFHIKSGEGFVPALTNQLKTVDGLTVGGMNRKHLHECLDEWIDNAIRAKESNG